MVSAVTDPDILAQLNGGGPKPVTDPMILKSLEPPTQMQGVGRIPMMAGTGFLGGLTKALAPLLGGSNPEETMHLPPDIQQQVIQGATETPGKVIQKGRDLGLYDRPGLEPQTGVERAVAAGASGAGGALPYAAFGGGLIPTLGAGIGGNLGAMYGQNLGEKLGYPKIGEVGGSFLGGLAGGTAGNLAVRGANALAGNYGPMGQAYKTAEVPMVMTGDISGSPSLQTAQEGASKMLGGSGRMHDAASAVTGAFGNTVENTAGSLGQSTTIQELGDKAQTAAKQWLTDFKAQSEKMHTGVSSLVGDQTPVTLSSTQQVLDGLKANAANNPAIESFLTSKVAGDLGRITAQAPQLGPWGGPTAPWSAARAIRSRLGQYLENPALIEDAGGAQAKMLYGALTDDLRGTATSKGPAALAAFDTANAFTKQGHDFIDNVVGPIMNKTAPQAAQGVLSSLKGGDQVIGPIANQMPALANEVAGFKLRDMAAATAGNQNAMGSAVSPKSFLTDWNNLSNEAKSVLYRDPAISAKVNSLAMISEGVKNSYKMANPSGSAAHAGLYGIIPSAVAGGELGHSIGGIPGAAIGTALGATAIPTFGRGLSYLGANRYLAPMLAARGAALGPGQAGLLGTIAGLSSGRGQ